MEKGLHMAKHVHSDVTSLIALCNRLTRSIKKWIFSRWRCKNKVSASDNPRKVSFDG